MPNITAHEYTRRLTKPMQYADPKEKVQFHNTARLLLKKLALLLPEYGEYEVRSNKGGIAVSGEITLHMDKLYVQVSQSPIMGLSHSILFRSCNGRKDYTGGRNHFSDLRDLPHTGKLANSIKQVIPT